MKHYDYIFTGGGLSALMTIYRMAVSGKFSGKSILLLEANAHKANDRTWSFWEPQGGELDAVVARKWDAALFADNDFRGMLDLAPYRYKTIRSKDFYDWVTHRISNETNIERRYEKVVDCCEAGHHCVVKTETESFTCNKIFNSIYNPDWAAKQDLYPVLQQHFIGWFVKTKELVFNPNQVTFMDFSVAQKGNTRFMYVLPFSETEALVEYTLFSKDLLPDTEYETAIESYLTNLGVTDFVVTEKERGSIPMTCYKFWKRNSTHILNIGSAGGWTKASTGYTFRNTMKKSAALVKFLETQTDLRQFHHTNRFWFYDLLLLDILDRHNGRGHEIFSAMFRRANPATILKFLDEETSLSEDLHIIWNCPKKLFIKALFKRLVR